jgi:hypothetical protein
MSASSLLARAASAISDKASLPIRAAAAATVAVGTLFGAQTATGQQIADNVPPSALGATAKQPNRLAPPLCDDAIKIGHGIFLDRYRGRVSPQLLESFLAFNRSACDLSTPFVRVEGTADEQAFGEYRVLLIALKMTSAARPAPLTK